MIVYIAGPYRPQPGKTIDDNIAQARKVAIAVWQAGHTAICPHLNTAHFEEDSGLPEERYLAGDLEILARCDAIVLTPDWETSSGAREEKSFALKQGMPCYVYPELPPIA